MHFLNGLDQRLAIAMGDEEIDVPPHASVTREYAEGRYRVLVRTPDGEVIEEQDVEVPGGFDFVAYSVLGAAPLFAESVVYTSGPGPGFDPLADTHFVSFAGRTWVTRRRVDFVLRDPPKSIEMAAVAAVERRSRVAVEKIDWRWAAAQLVADGNKPAAADMARRIALLSPVDEADLEFAYEVSRGAGDVAAMRAFVDAVLVALPESTAAHRLFQTHMEEQGAVDEILPRYRTAYEQAPDSARAAYLYGRIASFAVARPISRHCRT